MNERIKQLAEQVGWREGNILMYEEDMENFAQLIIKECINSIGDENSLHASTIYIRTLAEHRINKCFGIEE